MAASEDPPLEDLPKMDVRALTECMSVLPMAPGMYEVVSGSGHTYTVDVRQRSCTCPDVRYRDRECKHLRRVEYELGCRQLPDWARESSVDDHFQQFISPEDIDR